MTSAYKKTLELARQKGWTVTIMDDDVEFRPTSNDRNNAMLKESQKFAQALRAVHKDLSEMSRSVSTGLETVRKVLDAPLPRAYEDGPGGAFPDQKELFSVGDNVHTDAMSATNLDVKTRLTTEVLAPIGQWLEAYKAIKERNVSLENVRLELDVKRRSFLSFKAKYLKAVAKARSTQEQESIYFRAQTEEDKMNRLIQRYLEVEEEVYQALALLVKDAALLRDYLMASMLLFKRSFGGAVWAFRDAYPGLEVDDVPEAVVNAPKTEKPDLNARFGYLSTGSIAAHRVTSTAPVAAPADDGPLATATISESASGRKA